MILAVTAVLRFGPLFDYQYTYDELSGLDRTHFQNYGELLDKGVKVDAHPALIQSLLYYLVRFFGEANWLIKLPFLLLSLLTVGYAYGLGWRLYGKQSAMLFSTFAAFALPFVFYAPIARMYGPGMLFSMALLYYFFGILKSDARRTSDLVGFVMCLLLSAYNHHMNALFAATVAVAGIWQVARHKRNAYWIALGLAVILYLPHLNVTLYQLGVGGIGRDQGGWLEAPEWREFPAFIAMVLGSGYMYLVVLGALLFALVLKGRALFDKHQAILFALFGINFLIVFYYSHWRAAIYQQSVMLFSGMALLITILSLIRFENRTFFYAVLAVLLSSLIYTTYVKKDYLHSAVKTVYEYQYERTSEFSRQQAPGAVFGVFFDADSNMDRLYTQRYDCDFDYVTSKDSATFSMKHFSRLVSQLTCDYLVLSSSMPAHQALAKQYFPYLMEDTQTQAIHYRIYSKRKTANNTSSSDADLLQVSDPSRPGLFHYSDNSKLVNATGWKVDSLMEFPFEARADYGKVLAKEGQVLLAVAKLRVPERFTGEVELCIAVTDTVSGKNEAYTARSRSEFVPTKEKEWFVYTDYFAGTNHYRVKKNAQIASYLWNRGKVPFELEQFYLQTVDYWPQKWNFWK